MSQRTETLGYQPTNEVRQGYTGYEQDTESGLDFAQARYYNSAHGRFTSVDPLTASANVKNPQTFNRYSYVLNSPYKYTDPLGLISSSTGANGGRAWCSTCVARDDDDSWIPDPEDSAGDSQSNAADTPLAITETSTASVESSAQHADPPSSPSSATEQNEDPTNSNLQDITPEQRRQITLSIIEGLIDECFGVNSFTRSGKKVTKEAKKMIAELKRLAGVIYDITFKYEAGVPAMRWDNKDKNFYVKPNQSPESAVENASENIASEFRTEEFQAKRKNGRVDTFTYDRKGLKNVSGSIFSYVVQMAKNNYRLETDQREKNTRELYEHLPRNKWKSE